MKYKTPKTITIAILCSLVSLVASCNRKPAGRYYNGADYLDLKGDGTAYAMQNGAELSGKYSKEGKQLIISLNNGYVIPGLSQMKRESRYG